MHAFFEGKSPCANHNDECELCFLKSEYVHKFLDFSLELPLLPTDLFNHFFYISMNSYLFYNLGYNSILLCFVAVIVLSLTIGSSFSWLLCLSDIVPSLYFFCLVIPHFLALNIVQGTLIPFFLENNISHNMDAKYVHCYWDIFTSRPFQLTSNYLGIY